MRISDWSSDVCSSDLGDHLGHLEPRKLSALAGLGALRHLDLDLAALVQVLGGHAEASRGDLLDRGVLVVAVLARREARRFSPPSPESDLAPIDRKSTRLNSSH